MKKYILFDCDGTLVDSEALAMPIATKTLVAIAQNYGHDIPYDFVLQLFGKPIAEMVRRIEAAYDIRYQSDVADQIHSETVRILTAGTEATSGISTFLDHCLMQNFELAVVTSSSLDRVIPSLERAGLRRYFDNAVIFSAMTTLTPSQPKPSPAIYLHAMERLGITNPADTLTFEDSLTGVKSAKSAGVPVIGYLGGTHLRDIAASHGELLIKDGAHAVISHWQEATNLLPRNTTKPITHLPRMAP